MIKTQHEDKEQKQQRIFDAFLQTFPYEIGRSEDWTNRGVDLPIDFVHQERRIGVELTEWRTQERSKWVEQRDTFKSELRAAIHKRGLTQFESGGTGYTAVIYLENGPPRLRRKRKIIDNILSFLDNFVRANGPRFLSQRIVHLSACELPPTLRPDINSVMFYAFRTWSNIGIVVSEKPLNPAFPAPPSNIALASFRDRLTEKAIERANNYLCEKDHLQLRALWLVVHYSSPDVFPEPLAEFEMEIGYAGRKSQEAVGVKLKEAIDAIRDITRGPFDRIYFLVDCQPDPFSQLIFSKSISSSYETWPKLK